MKIARMQNPCDSFRGNYFTIIAIIHSLLIYVREYRTEADDLIHFRCIVELNLIYSQFNVSLRATSYVSYSIVLVTQSVNNTVTLQ